jgi:hypothetical protein
MIVPLWRSLSPVKVEERGKTQVRARGGSANSANEDSGFSSTESAEKKITHRDLHFQIELFQCLFDAKSDRPEFSTQSVWSSYVALNSTKSRHPWQATIIPPKQPSIIHSFQQWVHFKPRRRPPGFIVALAQELNRIVFEQLLNFQWQSQFLRFENLDQFLKTTSHSQPPLE